MKLYKMNPKAKRSSDQSKLIEAQIRIDWQIKMTSVGTTVVDA